MVDDVIKLEDRYIGTKKLKGQICRVVGVDNLNVYLSSLSFPQNPIVKVPAFYFKETFRKIYKESEERKPTLLTKTEIEDVVMIIDEVLKQAYLNKLISDQIANHLSNVTAFNLISILGDINEQKF